MTHRTCKECGIEKPMADFPSIKHYKCRACKAAVERDRRASPEFNKPILSPEKTAWKNMKNRCNNPNYNEYPRYGGRGVRVCDRWKESFSAFLEDMGQRPSSKHTLDRKDNDGNYEPGNCRWATRREQMLNTSRNVLVEHQGQQVPLSQLSELTGIDSGTLRTRVESGVTGAALAAPPRKAVQYSAFGEKRSLVEWAAVSGIDYYTLYSRIVKRGWDVEKAVSASV